MPVGISSIRTVSYSDLVHLWRLVAKFLEVDLEAEEAASRRLRLDLASVSILWMFYSSSRAHVKEALSGLRSQDERQTPHPGTLAPVEQSY